MKNYFASDFRRKCLAIVTLLSFIFTQSAFAMVNVGNGSFTDLTGLTADGEWNHGVPNSWNTLGGTNYIIYNTNTLLNLDHAGTISQTLGTVDAGGEDVTVSFDYGDMWNGWYYAVGEDMITVELINTTTPNTVTKIVKNNAAFGVMTSDSISITATANDVLEIRFTSLPGTGVTPGLAAALDNVSVRETTPPVLTAISSDTVDGTYLTAAVVDIDLTFSEPVSSTGLILNLDWGGTCTVAAFNDSTTTTCDYTVGTTENSSDLTVTSVAGTITDGATNNTVNPVPTSNLAAVKDIVIYNAVPPVLTEVTPVTTPTYDTTPSYTFNTTKAGTLTYGGDCSSVTTSAVAGDNTVTFDTLSLGVHNNCTIMITDGDTMTDTLNVPSFKIIPAPNTVVVNSTTVEWAHNSDGSATPGTGSFAAAPTPPLGSGAFQMTLANNITSAYYLGTTLHNSTPIADLTKLSYSTYRVAGDPAVAPTLQINIDADNTDGNTGWQGRLIYEPYHTQTVSTGVWQNWNALNDSAGTGTGNWWFSNGALAASTTCTMSNPCTWAEIKTKIPNGAIHGTLGAIGFKAGTGWSSYDGFIDNFNIAFDSTGADTTYNFEYDTAAPGVSVVTPVPTVTNDTTPDYAFTTDEDVTLTYGGSCSSATAAATVGPNTITFNTLADGTYSDCTVTLTDSGSNTVVLNVNAFTVDTTVPVITLLGTTPLTIERGTTYVDAGATASDSFDGDKTANIATVNWVNANAVGTYTVTYNVSDNAGNAAIELTRTVNVVDTTAPIISNVTTEVLYPAGLSIRWTTNEPTTSQVQYGPTTSYGSTSPLDSTLVTEHIVDIHGLDSPAEYHFEIITTDGSGNTASTTTSGTGSASTSEGGSGGVTSTGGGLFQTPVAPAPTNPTTPTTPTQPTTPDNNSNPESPDNTTPETSTPEVTPTPETPTNPNLTTPENTETPTQPTALTGNTTGGTAGGNAGPGFNPADATLDIGGAGTPEEEPVVEEATPTVDPTLDAGGWAIPEETSYTLLWTLLALIALLNTWWFFVAKNKNQPTHRRD